MEAAQKTTISVPEMTRLLGLKKTEGYWLVHKKQFQTVMIAGQMRIVLILCLAVIKHGQEKTF